MVELTGEEIIYLWEKKYGAKFPDELSLEKAGAAVLLEYGAEAIEVELKKAFENG
jgi:hypothetical protein